MPFAPSSVLAPSGSELLRMPGKLLLGAHPLRSDVQLLWLSTPPETEIWDIQETQKSCADLLRSLCTTEDP